DSSSGVTKTQFERFAGQLVATHTGVQALEWIPRVPQDERASMEAAARKDYPGFEISVRESQGKMVRAGASDEYFPVRYVVPLAGNQTAIGFDLASNPARLEALRNARDRGVVTATSRIVLVQERFEQSGFLIFRPVYRQGIAPDPAGISPDSVEHRRANLLG